MIEFTIKTLDSNNHTITVDDDTTVYGLKQKVLEKLGIEIDQQRLIFFGRVLHDNKKLSEYGVDGKVVHLVERPPPRSSRQPHAAPEEPPSEMARRTYEMPFSITNENEHPTSPIAARIEFLQRSIDDIKGLMEVLRGPDIWFPQPESQRTTPEFERLDGSGIYDPSAPHLFTRQVRRRTKRSKSVHARHPSSSQTKSKSYSPQPGPSHAGLAQPGPSQAGPSHVVISQPGPSNAMPQSGASTAGPSTAGPSSAGPSAQAVSSIRTEPISPNDSPTNGASSDSGLQIGASAAAMFTDRLGRVFEPKPNVPRTQHYADLLTELMDLEEQFNEYRRLYVEWIRSTPGQGSAAPAPSDEETVRRKQQFSNLMSELHHCFAHAYHVVSDLNFQVTPTVNRIVSEGVVASPIQVQVLATEGQHTFITPQPAAPASQQQEQAQMPPPPPPQPRNEREQMPPPPPPPPVSQMPPPQPQPQPQQPRQFHPSAEIIMQQVAPGVQAPVMLGTPATALNINMQPNPVTFQLEIETRSLEAALLNTVSQFVASQVAGAAASAANAASANNPANNQATPPGNQPRPQITPPILGLNLGTTVHLGTFNLGTFHAPANMDVDHSASHGTNMETDGQAQQPNPAANTATNTATNTTTNTANNAANANQDGQNQNQNAQVNRQMWFDFENLFRGLTQAHGLGEMEIVMSVDGSGQEESAAGAANNPQASPGILNFLPGAQQAANNQGQRPQRRAGVRTRMRAPAMPLSHGIYDRFLVCNSPLARRQLIRRRQAAEAARQAQEERALQERAKREDRESRDAPQNQSGVHALMRVLANPYNFAEAMVVSLIVSVHEATTPEVYMILSEEEFEALRRVMQTGVRHMGFICMNRGFPVTPQGLAVLVVRLFQEFIESLSLITSIRPHVNEFASVHAVFNMYMQALCAVLQREPTAAFIAAYRQLLASFFFDLSCLLVHICRDGFRGFRPIFEQFIEELIQSVQLEQHRDLLRMLGTSLVSRVADHIETSPSNPHQFVVRTDGPLPCICFDEAERSSRAVSRQSGLISPGRLDRDIEYPLPPDPQASTSAEAEAEADVEAEAQVPREEERSSVAPKRTIADAIEQSAFAAAEQSYTSAPRSSSATMDRSPFVVPERAASAPVDRPPAISVKRLSSLTAQPLSSTLTVDTPSLLSPEEIAAVAARLQAVADQTSVTVTRNPPDLLLQPTPLDERHHSRAEKRSSSRASSSDASSSRSSSKSKSKHHGSHHSRAQSSDPTSSTSDFPPGPDDTPMAGLERFQKFRSPYFSYGRSSQSQPQACYGCLNPSVTEEQPYDPTSPTPLFFFNPALNQQRRGYRSVPTATVTSGSLNAQGSSSASPNLVMDSPERSPPRMSTSSPVNKRMKQESETDHSGDAQGAGSSGSRKERKGDGKSKKESKRKHPSRGHDRDPNQDGSAGGGSSESHGQSRDDKSVESEWGPIIENDLRIVPEPQPPFSDAYLSGMSARRRRRVRQARPPLEAGAFMHECLSAASERAIEGGDVERSVFRAFYESFGGLTAARVNGSEDYRPSLHSAVHKLLNGGSSQEGRPGPEQANNIAATNNN